MTMKQKAIAALIGLLGAGGGTVVGQDALRGLLSGTCAQPVEVVDRVLPRGGTEKTVTVGRAVNLINQHCGQGPNTGVLLEQMTLRLTSPAGGN